MKPTRAVSQGGSQILAQVSREVKNTWLAIALVVRAYLPKKKFGAGNMPAAFPS
jgi:hypothetical protein